MKQSNIVSPYFGFYGTKWHSSAVLCFYETVWHSFAVLCFHETAWHSFAFALMSRARVTELRVKLLSRARLSETSLDVNDQSKGDLERSSRDQAKQSICLATPTLPVEHYKNWTRQLPFDNTNSCRGRLIWTSQIVPPWTSHLLKSSRWDSPGVYRN